MNGLIKKYKKVGVDIGSFSVKAVSLEKGLFKKNYTVSCAIEYLPTQASPSQISESIKNAVKKVGVTVPRVSISVSGQEVIFRYIQLPVMRNSEIIEAVKLEWDKYISLKPDEVISDLQVLGEISDPLKGKQILVLLAAAKKDFLAQQTHLLKEAGLGTDIIDTNVSCLVNAFNFLYPLKSKNSLVALLNIGESITNLIILKDGIPRFSRDILFGGRDVTVLISQKKRISFLNAQELKHNFNGDDQEILAVIKNSVANLNNELKLSFDYLKRDLEEEIKAIYISGGTAHLYGIKDFLNQDLGINVETWRVNKNLRQRGNPEKKLESYFPELAVSIGLVLT